MSDAPEAPRGGVAGAFRAEPLPRWRALLAVVGFAAAFLSAGGMLEYAAGSPDAGGTTVATYWALFFALNTLAFGGAALLAGFPALAQRRVKLLWLAAMAALYVTAFRVWYGHQPDDAIAAWLARSATYLPAALAVVIGAALPGSHHHAQDPDATSELR